MKTILSYMSHAFLNVIHVYILNFIIVAAIKHFLNFVCIGFYIPVCSLYSWFYFM